MNPKLALPLVAILFGFGFTWQQVLERTETGNAANSYASVAMGGGDLSSDIEKVDDVPGQPLLSPEQAKAKLAESLKKNSDNYRFLSRVRVHRPATLTSIELNNGTPIAETHFLGAITTKVDLDQRIAPISINRKSGAAMAFLGTNWVVLDRLNYDSIFRQSKPLNEKSVARNEYPISKLQSLSK